MVNQEKGAEAEVKVRDGNVVGEEEATRMGLEREMEPRIFRTFRLYTVVSSLFR